MNKKEQFNMLEECVDEYKTIEHATDQFEIKILAPMKFRNIWLVKLNELKTCLEEVEEWNEKS